MTPAWRKRREAKELIETAESSLAEARIVLDEESVAQRKEAERTQVARMRALDLQLKAIEMGRGAHA